MLLSVFTPVQRTDFLREAWRSLLLQDVAWEWILGLTGGLSRDQLPAEIVSDSRVRVIRCSRIPPELAPGIGRAKRECCRACRGDVLVELDHDDVLVPGILSKIAGLTEQGAGFVYSDAAVFHNDRDLTPAEYSPEYGWSSYPVRIYGRTFLANRSFGISARALADVMFSPDHIRAWTRQAYERAGGHDPDLPVGDDHDLLCRTYLTGVGMVHTGSAGYLYRWHGQNTTTRYNQAIQKQNVVNRNRYMTPLIGEWCRRNRYAVETVGPGQDPLSASAGWKPREFGQVFLDGCLSRCPPDAIPELLRRVRDALVPGGWFSLRNVSSDSKWAFMPHCRSFWNEASLSAVCSPGYWTEHWPELGFQPGFQPVRIVERRNREVDGGQDRVSCLEIVADLCCPKGLRHPGVLP